MVQVEPTATPPASVAFWMSSIEKTFSSRRKRDSAKDAMQLPVWAQSFVTDIECVE